MTAVDVDRVEDAPVTGAATRRWPGLLAAAVGLGGALLAHRFVPAVGVLTWAVALAAWHLGRIEERWTARKPATP